MMRERFRSIRTRLTIWHTLVFGGILVLFAVGTSAFLIFTLNAQLDDSLKEDLEIVEQLLSQTPVGSYPLKMHPNPVDRLERFVEIWSAEGRLLFRSETLQGRSLGREPYAGEVGEEPRITSVAFPDATHWRVATAKVATQGEWYVVRLAVSEGEFYTDIRRFVTVIVAGIPVGLLLVVVSGYMLARAALRPIVAMASRARRISVRDLGERIPVRVEDDELGLLAGAFNDLLGRVARSFEELKRFAADASHELRTPLTAMRSVGEVGVQGDRTPKEYREIIGSMLEEMNRLARVVDSLLLLSTSGESRRDGDRQEIDLLQFVEETAGLMQVLAEERDQLMSVRGDSGIVISADPSLLRHALLNLIDNAIKYSPDHGRIDLRVTRGTDDMGWCEVADNGPGIPVNQRERIFERFYRIGGTRDRGGAGLGLAIVQWAVGLHEGKVQVFDNAGGGSIFRVALPILHK